ncbi:MAG: hypothetical protein V4608_07990 [Bacteroidota bacterium]
MSKKKHDNISNDENSDMETSHSNEAQHENNHTHVTMSSIEFETKLNEFFTKHKPSKLRHVAKIVSQFAGQEELVLEHLNNKYVLGIPTGKTKKTAGQKSLGGHDSGHGHGHDVVEETAAKPKSKKKLILIISIVLVLVLAGVGFMMKDKLFGGGHGKEAEHGAPAAHGAAAGHGDAKAAGHDAHGAEAKPTEEVVTPPAAPADSAAATAVPAEAAHTEAAPAEHSGH